MAGISNASIAQIDEAYDVLGGRLASIQNESRRGFAPASRSCGIALSAASRFCRGACSVGCGRADNLAGRHAAFGRVAARRGVSPQQVCLAWMLAKAPVVVPIPGCSRPETIRDSAAAADLDLTAVELSALE